MPVQPVRRTLYRADKYNNNDHNPFDYLRIVFEVSFLANCFSYTKFSTFYQITKRKLYHILHANFGL